MSLSRNQIIDWLRKIDITNKTVLDVGSGKKTKQARDYTKGEPKKYVTLYINKEVEPDIVMDLNDDDRDMWELDEFNGDYVPDIMCENYFDIVFCLETLEHCWNILNAVRILYDTLKEGGACYISVPFINPIHDQWDYLRFTGEWFERVLPKVGFKKVEVERRVATEGLKSLTDFYRLEAMRMSRLRIKRGEGHKIADVGYLIIAGK